MTERRNPYRPGTASYARLRGVRLKRKAALAEANAARAKTPETRRRSTQRASAAKRALRKIETREGFRSKLTEPERSLFDRLPITWQDQELKVDREFPDGVPRDQPDPFTGPHRDSLWRLSYATRAGIRLRAVA
jgi:hypothetical protein